jgi:hypothetical protein
MSWRFKNATAQRIAILPRARKMMLNFLVG